MRPLYVNACRRDARPLDKRPAHLQPGHASFTGREMTDETRKKLGLGIGDDGGVKQGAVTEA